MEATSKSPETDSFLTSITGVSRVESVEKNTCVMCKGKAETFSDKLSEKEFTISGLCQTCQDGVFG